MTNEMIENAIANIWKKIHSMEYGDADPESLERVMRKLREEVKESIKPREKLISMDEIARIEGRLSDKNDEILKLKEDLKVRGDALEACNDLLMKEREKTFGFEFRGRELKEEIITLKDRVMIAEDERNALSKANSGLYNRTAEMSEEIDMLKLEAMTKPPIFIESFPSEKELKKELKELTKSNMRLLAKISKAGKTLKE